MRAPMSSLGLKSRQAVSTARNLTTWATLTPPLHYIYNRYARSCHHILHILGLFESYCDICLCLRLKETNKNGLRLTFLSKSLCVFFVGGGVGSGGMSSLSRSRVNPVVGLAFFLFFCRSKQMVASTSFVPKFFGHEWTYWSLLWHMFSGCWWPPVSSRRPTTFLRIQLEVQQFLLQRGCVGCSTFSQQPLHKSGILFLQSRCRICKGQLWFVGLAMVASTSIAEAPTRIAPRLYLLKLAILSSSPSSLTQTGSPVVWNKQTKEPIVGNFFFWQEDNHDRTHKHLAVIWNR